MSKNSVDSISKSILGYWIRKWLRLTYISAYFKRCGKYEEADRFKASHTVLRSTEVDAIFLVLEDREIIPEYVHLFVDALELGVGMHGCSDILEEDPVTKFCMRQS